MSSLPSLSCDSDEYKTVYPFFVTLLSVVSVGAPVGLLVFVICAQRANRLFSAKYRERFGPLHEAYKQKYYFYEVFVIVRYVSVRQ